MLEKNTTAARKERHKITQEDFTPDCIIEMLLDGAEDLYTDFSKNYLDPCAGVFYIIRYILRRRLANCKTQRDAEKALVTLWGTELMDDNVEEGRQNLRDVIVESGFKVSKKVEEILTNNFICTDTFRWNYNEWCPLPEPDDGKSYELF